MKKKFIFVLCCIFCLLFFGVAKSFGASDIILNEIGATEPSGYEWVELFNRGTSDVDLTGYKFFEENVNHGLTLKQGSFVLKPNEFAVIAQDDVKLKQKYPNIFSSLFDSSWGSLNEPGEHIGLKDISGNFLEQFMYASTTNFSLERVDAKNDDITFMNWKEHPSGNTLGEVNFASLMLPQDMFSPSEEITPQVVSSTEVLIGESTSSTPVEANTHTEVLEILAVTSTENVMETASSSSQIVENVIAEEQSLTDTSSPSEILSNVEDVPILVTINEFLPQPNDGEKEWIELFNDSLQEVVLNNWTLEDQIGKIANVSTTIRAKSFFVVELSLSKLNNDGDSVYLKNEEGMILDEVHYGEEMFVLSKKGNSLAKWQESFQETTTVTKGQENILTPPIIAVTEKSASSVSVPKTSETLLPKAPSTSTAKTSTSPKKMTSSIKEKTAEVDGKKRIVDPNIQNFVFISEICPAPKKGEDEFVEIFNSASSTFDLSYFQLDDADGGSKPFVFASGTFILPRQYLVISKKSSHISLNNSEDSARILFPNGEIMEEVMYEDAVKENSFIKNEQSEWVWTSEVTMAATNVFVDVEETETQKKTLSSKQKFPVSTSVENLDNFQSGDVVRIKGKVVVLPGVFGSQIFYVSDGPAVQIYMSKKDFPALLVGDEVLVTGIIGVTAGETRIKVQSKKDIVKIQAHEPVRAEPLSLFDVDESLHGTLATVSGEVTEKKSNFWFVDDGNGEIQVSFKKGANIDGQKIRLGDKVSVTGLVLNSKATMQLFPRSQKDIVVELGASSTSNVAKMTESNSSKKILLVILGGAGAFFLGLFIKFSGNTIFFWIKEIIEKRTYTIKQKKNLGE